ncbi:hypothetical protein ANO11243_055600 [Dothideomycetidae sp. 11243]|nr:hypothetical protein ANO11243_055600 [fungal sp. No.11243]
MPRQQGWVLRQTDRDQNMLRQNLVIYSDSYMHDMHFDDTRGPHSAPLLTVLDHCVDSLRLSLMCEADMTLAPMVWSNEKERMIPDFEIEHTCRDYDALKEWAKDRDSYDADTRLQNAARMNAARNVARFGR